MGRKGTRRLWRWSSGETLPPTMGRWDVVEAGNSPEPRAVELELEPKASTKTGKTRPHEGGGEGGEEEEDKEVVEAGLAGSRGGHNRVVSGNAVRGDGEGDAREGEEGGGREKMGGRILIRMRIV